MIYVINGVLTCIAIALNLGVSVGSVVRQATQLAVSADAALLVLAPIFVIAADFSLFTVPLIALIAFLVYNSSRRGPGARPPRRPRPPHQPAQRTVVPRARQRIHRDVQ